LYDKTEKLYANGNVKTEAWTQIDTSLTHPLEGKFISVIDTVLQQFVIAIYR